jgi:hypothetical protein
MFLVEVLPEVQSLSRLDKIRLIQFLAQELERDDGRPDRAWPVVSRLVHRQGIQRRGRSLASVGGG